MSGALRAAVFGASGAIGGAVVEALRADPVFGEVAACSRGGDGHLRFDLTDEASIAAACAELGQGGPLDLVFVATGMLHEAGGAQPEKALRALDPAVLQRAYALNAVGPMLIAKHAVPLFSRERRTVFAALSARVGSIADNRLGGWHSYRASKAALNMLLRNLAIELARTHPRAVVAALHPGTVDSALSRPFQRGLRDGQLADPASAAARLLRVLKGIEPAQSGHLWDWNGAQIPF